MPINDYFIFDGKKSTDFGLYMASDPNATHPARRGETFPIPGRNGVIVREDGSYDTYTQNYDVFFDSNMHAADIYGLARSVASWLLGSRGFCRLEDSYEPEYFRIARCAAQMSVENRLARFGRAQIPFECQPQRYLKSGETPISYEGDSTTVFSITNPTQFEARPLLKFVDTSEEPVPVQQTVTRVERTDIGSDGSVVSASSLNYTCQPISVSGYVYAYISGNSYAFYDSDGNVISFVYSYYKEKRVQMDNVQVIIPSGAATIVVGTFDDFPDVAVSLKAARPNPGASAVTINGVTISLDFSAYDTIYLDCDLHDAYYIDGSSANDKVSFTSNIDPYPTFPGLLPGENTIIPGDGSNLDFELTPRWWTL